MKSVFRDVNALMHNEGCSFNMKCDFLPQLTIKENMIQIIKIERVFFF